MVDEEIPDIPIFIPLDLDEYFDTQKSQVEINYDKLPLLFHPMSKPFSGNHLYNLYRQSYFCILNGFYHAGILVLSQLLRVNTDGDYRKSIFEDLIRKVKTENTGRKNNALSYLVHPELLLEIEEIKDEIRNSYMHMRFDRMFKDQTTPVAVIKINLDSESLSKQEQKNNDSNDEKRSQLYHLPINLDPVISSIFKDERDKKLAFDLAWKIYSLYWLLLELYLPLERYQEHIKKHGSYLEKLQPMTKKSLKELSDTKNYHSFAKPCAPHSSENPPHG